MCELIGLRSKIKLIYKKFALLRFMNMIRKKKERTCIRFTILWFNHFTKIAPPPIIARIEADDRARTEALEKKQNPLGIRADMLFGG